jgi:hypothetical protein
MSTRNWGKGHRRREMKTVGKSGELRQDHMGKDLRESLGGTHSEASTLDVSDEVIGIAGVLHAIEGIEFPISRDDLLAQVRGKRVIGWRGGGLIDFDQLLDGFDESFGSKLSFMSAVSERLRDQRESSVRGWVGRHEEGSSST